MWLAHLEPHVPVALLLLVPNYCFGAVCKYYGEVSRGAEGVADLMEEAQRETMKGLLAGEQGQQVACETAAWKGHKLFSGLSAISAVCTASVAKIKSLQIEECVNRDSR